MKPFLVPGRLALLAGAVAVAGCGVDVAETNEVSVAGVAQAAREGFDASCTHPRRYVVVLNEGECSEVPAVRGRWVPSPLFDDAPSSIGACVYTWSGEPHARVDRAALTTHVDAAGGVLTASCDATANVSETASLEAIPHVDTPIFVGSPGCDVCGMLRGNQIWVVLPPSVIQVRQFAVELSDGSTRAFQIHVDEGARAMSVALPKPPAGVSYVDGRVTIF